MNTLKPRTAKPILQMTTALLLCKTSATTHRRRARCREPCPLAGLIPIHMPFL